MRQVTTFLFVICGFTQWILATHASCANLLVGTSTIEITPPQPVAVCGQFHLRIARDVETPLMANVIVIQSRHENGAADMAILVSCDIVSIPDELRRMVRTRVEKQVPEIDVSKIILSGTHTHTAPVVETGMYRIPKDGVMQVDEYRSFLADRVAAAVGQAWQGRRAASVTWGLSHAVVGYNRRAVYADGSAQMYGATNLAAFRNLEGFEDHDVDLLFFFDESAQLSAIAINLACPAQEVESRSTIHADFWHPVRQQLQRRFGEELCVLPWIGASGDQSPHLMYRLAADERMRKLRGLDRTDEIARRVVRAVEDAYEVVKQDRHADVAFMHRVENLQLPMRLVTEAEYAEAKEICERIGTELAGDPTLADREFMRLMWYGKTVSRFEVQRSNPDPIFPMELHAVRIGDVVICTNPFELFTDYGIRIKARSKAVQTFVVQLAGRGTYLPTEKAIRGGHYSAVVHSSHVGPEGGQILVDRTVDLINSMWDDSSHAPN